MPTLTLDLTPPEARPVLGVRLFFDLTRTAFTGEFSVTGAPPGPEARLDFPLAQLHFTTPTAEPFSLTLEYRGEEPAHTWVPHWLAGDALRPEYLPVSELLGLKGRLSPEEARYLGSTSSESFEEAWKGHVDRYNTWVCNRIDKEGPGPRQDAMLFFVDLDQNTMPIQLRGHCEFGDASGSECVAWPPDGCEGYGDRIRAIDSTSQELVAWILWRCAQATGEAPPSPPIDRSALELLSAAQRPIYECHFPTDDPDRGARLLEAYTLFAAGDLREPGRAESRWNARPDSLFYLLFAEFAIQCIEHGVDEDLWRFALPALVSTQELFGRAHPPTLDGHDWSTLPKPTIQIGTAGADFERVRHLYGRLDFEGLRAAHAANSLYLRDPRGRTLYSGDAPMANEKKLESDAQWRRAAKLLAGTQDAGANFDPKWVVMDEKADRAIPDVFYDREEALAAADDEGLIAFGPFRMAATSDDGWTSTSGDPHPWKVEFKTNKVLSMTMRNGKAISAVGGYTVFIE